ncbi:MAG: 50S ribosomal protein L24 [Bacteroidia bacterium]|jgi:large subunit ribosomal protein L24|nr:50S ribosomal protein L24 [Bacteroidia bacterium]
MGVKLHIKKGDQVRVLSGSDRGSEGRVLEVFPKESRAIVEGVRLVTKHVRPSQQNPDGGTVRQEAPIHISKLMVIDPATRKPTRVGRKPNPEGGWLRYSKKSGEILK